MKKKPQISWGSKLIKVARVRKPEHLPTPPQTNRRGNTAADQQLDAAHGWAALDHVTRIMANFWDTNDASNRNSTVPINLLETFVTPGLAFTQVSAWSRLLRTTTRGIPAGFVDDIDDVLRTKLTAQIYLNIMNSVCRINTNDRRVYELIVQLRADFCRMVYRWFDSRGRVTPPIVAELRQNGRIGIPITLTEYLQLWELMRLEQIMQNTRITPPIRPADDDPF